MTIGNAVERDSTVFVFDEKGKQIYVRSAGFGPNDGLKSYTSEAVNIRHGSFIYTYDEEGKQTMTLAY
jgi:hypothetical protein